VKGKSIFISIVLFLFIFILSVHLLNINKDITALASGALDPSLKRDILFIGGQTSLQAYGL